MIEYKKRLIKFNSNNYYKQKTFYFLIYMGFNCEKAKSLSEGLASQSYDLCFFDNQALKN